MTLQPVLALMFKNILVVCIGNICRSPTAEALLVSRLAPRGITVASAGLHALEGKPMDATALEVLREHGGDHPDHQGRQLTRELLRQYDLILTMEQGHIQRIVQLAPEARGKTFLLGKWQGNQEIPDPYRQQKPAFEHVYQLMAQGVESWSQKL
ncbi:Low molecular weight protein-tyrosine-phosphatase Wzb [compost metagenome]